MDKAIIVQSFGTSHEDAYVKSFKSLVLDLKNRFPDYEIVEAFSSEMVRKIVEKKGEFYPNTKIALENLYKKGIKDIRIFALYVIEGFEYEGVERVSKNFDSNIKISRALIHGGLNINSFSEEIMEAFNYDTDALVLMGHGSRHSRDKDYELLNDSFSHHGRNIFLASLEGDYGIFELIDELKKKNIKKVTLAPFLLVAGDHAKNDMASDDKDSWKSILEENGFDVKIDLKGLLEREKIKNIFFERLEEILWNY